MAERRPGTGRYGQEDRQNRCGACAWRCTTAATCSGPVQPCAGTAPPRPPSSRRWCAPWARRWWTIPPRWTAAATPSTEWARRQDSLAMLERKLSDVRSQEIDALVVSCPSCFLQFDLNQAAQTPRDRRRHTGVLHHRTHSSRSRPQARGTGARPAPGGGGAVPGEMGGQAGATQGPRREPSMLVYCRPAPVAAPATPTARWPRPTPTSCRRP